MKTTTLSNLERQVVGWIGLLLLTLSTTHGQVTIVPIPTLGGSSLSAEALNNKGQIVGYSFTAGDVTQNAFLFSQNVLYNLGTLGGTFSMASGVNDSGLVIGESSLPGEVQIHAFLFQQGQMVDLGSLGGTYSSPSAVNRSGWVVGLSTLLGDYVYSAFLHRDGVLTNLGSLGGTYSAGTALNNLGDIVGESLLVGDMDLHAFLYRNGAMFDLGTLGGYSSSAKAINDAGQIVGDSDVVGNLYSHAFLHANGQMTDLGTLGGTFSAAAAINESGQIIGNSTLANGAYHGFIYQGGAMVDLGTLGGNSSQVAAINKLGQVVGETTDASTNRVAFLWQNGVMEDLTTVLPPNSGWVLWSATGINDAGQIVGYGLYQGAYNWFLLSYNRPPVADAGPDQTIQCPQAATLDGSNSSDPDGDPIAFEWREGGLLLGTNATLAVSLSLGAHEITLTVSDPKGLTSQDTIIVTVVDTTPPSVVCPGPIQASADASCQAAIPDVAGSASASDSCAAANTLVRTQSPAPGTVVGLGTHQVTVTVTDPSGNSSACSTTFTVADTTPPTVQCPGPIQVSADANCQAAIPDLTGIVNASDNCAGALARTQSPAPGTLVSLGTHQVTVTVTDAAGNASACSTTFTVVDTTPPTIQCPGPIQVSADANCQAAIPDLTGSVQASDNCGGVLTRTQSPAAGTLVGLGTHQVTVTVTDAAGNASTCTTAFTVVDTTAPVIQSVSATPNLLAQANREMVLVTITVNAVDNCDPAPIRRIIEVTSSEPQTGNGDNTYPDWEITGPLTLNVRAERSPQGVGRTYTITVECVDASGNRSTGSTTVFVPKGKI